MMSKLQLTCMDANFQELRVFKPGQKVHFKIETKQEMDRYHISVLDQSNNPRLHCYGKASNKKTFEWLIPKTIKERHLGIWQIQFKSGSDTHSLLFCVE